MVVGDVLLEPRVGDADRERRLPAARDALGERELPVQLQPIRGGEAGVEEVEPDLTLEHGRGGSTPSVRPYVLARSAFSDT